MFFFSFLCKHWIFVVFDVVLSKNADFDNKKLKLTRVFKYYPYEFLTFFMTQILYL